MNKLNKLINLKSVALLTTFLLALSSFIVEPTEAVIQIPGVNYSKHETSSEASTETAVDPLPGTFFDGRITIRYNRLRVLPIDKNKSGWFGAFSHKPDTPFLDTGNGIFADADISANLLKNNEKLKVSKCNVQFPEKTVEFKNSKAPSQIIDCDGDVFDPFISLPLPGQSSTTSFKAREIFPDDDFFAVNFDFGDKGFTVDTKESFNFFGFSYQFNPQAFDDKVVGISLVKSGKGDVGLVAIEGFNVINCIPIGSSESKVATDRCGEPDIPLDVKYITRNLVLADSKNQDFSYDFKKKEGTFSTGEPFQLFNDSFLRNTNNKFPVLLKLVILILSTLIVSALLVIYFNPKTKNEKMTD